MKPRLTAVRTLGILAPALAAGLWSCWIGQQVSSGGSGNGSETEALVRGRARLPDGSPAAAAEVRLLRADFRPGDPDSAAPARAGEDGAFALDVRVQRDKRYTLEIRAAGRGVAHAGLDPAAGGWEFPADTLRAYGAVAVGLRGGGGPGRLLMSGTSRAVAVPALRNGADTLLVLDSLAPGSAGAVYFAPDAGSASATLATGVVVAPANLGLRAGVTVYSDSSSLVTGTWVNCCGFAEDSASPAYEGRKSYRFDYKLVGWYAGAGLNLDGWWSLHSYDLSHCRSIRFAYRGLTAGHGLYLRAQDGDSLYSQAVRVGGASDTFTVAEVPLTALTGIDLRAVKELDFGVSDAESGEGTVWIDAVEVRY